MPLVIEGHIAYLAADRIAIFAGQAVNPKTGKKKEFVGLLPDVRLILDQPVGFALPDGFIDDAVLVDGFKNPCEEGGKMPLHFRLPLIQPENGRPQGGAVYIQIDHGGALGSDGHPGDAVGGDPFGVEQPAGCGGEAFPVIIQLLFGPAGLTGEIRRNGRLDHMVDFSPRIDQGRTDGLGAGIENQNLIPLSACCH